MKEKSELRAALRRARKRLPPAVRRAATQRINTRLKKLIRRKQTIAVYRAAGSEVVLTDFIQAALRRGAAVFEPHTVKHSRRLWFSPWGQAFARQTPRKRIEQMQLAILPLVGIDHAGFRLGQGGGYYDTSLAFCRSDKPRLLGVGFACQIVPAVPRENHDRRLDAFICERSCLTFRP